MRIGIDLDDTLGHSTKAFAKFHNNVYKTSLKEKKLITYGWLKAVGGPKDEFGMKVQEFHKTSYGENTEPIKHSKRILKKLKKDNEIYIITSRPDSVREETEKWVENNFPDIFSKIYFAKLKNNAKITKRAICDNLDIEVLIEDNLKHAVECVAPNRTVYLLNYPWNQAKKLPKGVRRVYSWKEIGELI